ncbi:efflux RND transporter periplasmic adaptor subunit [Caenimonas sp. SL110]|uniref:efflux RND transporter periplasmic adaptor subunit n=1 Tax=Caenimonas sp. SL110 TaxID=1450524 RepID=UPI0006547E2A
MDQEPVNRETVSTTTIAEPPRRAVSRRSTIIGSVIALLAVAGIGWLAWSLTHPDTPAAGAGGARPGASGASAGGGGGPGGGGAGGRAGGRGPATTVGVAIAERMEIPVVVDALGTVIPQASVRVRPQVSGVLQRVIYKEGQMVRKGELLAVIDPRQFEMTVQQAAGQRLRDEAQLAAARVTLERYRTLLGQDSIARQEVDTQAALVKQLEAAVVIAKANEGAARLNLSYTNITAPIAGRIGLRAVDVGNVVSTGDANGVALITQLSPIDVEFAIPQDQAVTLQQNVGAFMEVKAFDRTRTTVLDVGTFASLDNQIDTQTGTVRAKARFNNARQSLFPSQFVNVQLNMKTIRDAVVVPVAAVRQGPAGVYVFVLNDDRTVTQRTVTRGIATVDKVQIATGLQVGERVITEGADRLRDGSRVVLPGDAPGAGRPGGGRRMRGADGAASAAAGASLAPAAPVAPAASGAASGATAGPRARSAASAGSAPRGASAPVAGPAPAAAPAAAAPVAGPTPEQRQRMLESAKDDPEMLARRKAFLERLDKGDPAALERWAQMQQRRAEGGGRGEGRRAQPQ